MPRSRKPGHPGQPSSDKEALNVFLFSSFISLGERLTFCNMSGRETICFLFQLKLFVRVRNKCQAIIAQKRKLTETNT